MFLKDEGKICRERHLHPSVYKKLIKTRKLIQENVDPDKFQSRGGLDLKTYQALQLKWREQEREMKDLKQKVINQYGSLKATPLSVGPCRKRDPVIGSKNALALLTEFKDKKHTYNSDEFEKILFSKGSNQSMRDYYLEASWNQLDIAGKVHNQWFTAPLSKSEYSDDPTDAHYPLAQKLVKNTLIQAKNSGNFDFTSFARNGKIEILIVVFAGIGFDTKLNIKYIRPHQGWLSEPIEVQKGIWAERYCLVPELPMDDLGCFCHELGHILGLPDFYKEGYSPVIGSWCLMAIGDHNDGGKTPAHPNAWCKVHLGWKEPKIIEELPQQNEIPAIMDDEGMIYKLEVPGSDGGEYFLLENRQQKGFDRNLPGSGLLIWHIDENRCVHQAPNSDPEHFFLTLKQSDGKNQLQMDMKVLMENEGQEAVMKDLAGDAGDPYPGITFNRNFDEQSNPSSQSYQGANSMVSVTSITDSSDLMKAQIGVQHPSNVVTSKPATSTEQKTHQFMLQNFMALMASREEEDPYDKGYDDGKQDAIEKLKEEHLNSYQEGYQTGYRRGYRKAQKKLKR